MEQPQSQTSNNEDGSNELKVPKWVEYLLEGLKVTVKDLSKGPVVENLTTKDYKERRERTIDVDRVSVRCKVYSPNAWQKLRAADNVDIESFVNGWTSFLKKIPEKSVGKSRSLFGVSDDKKFLLKTLIQNESKYLRNMMNTYIPHLLSNGQTLLMKIYAHGSISYKGGNRPVYFIIFENVLIGTSPFKTYDLKGSTEDRFMSEKDIAKNPKAPWKDENFLKNKDKLPFASEEAKNRFLKQLKADTDILEGNYVMDYSLLVAYCEKHEVLQSSNVIIKHRAFELNDDKFFVCGVIDFLQFWSARKKWAHVAKAGRLDAKRISTVEPHYYAKRFFQFCTDATNL